MAEMAVPAEFHSQAVAMAPIAADPHTETEWLPVQTASLTPTPLTPVSTGAIVVVSDTLVRSADPAAFRTLRREIEEGAIRATDTRALAPALDGVDPITPTESPLHDLRRMLNEVSTTGAARLLFVAAPDAANTIATTAPHSDFGQTFSAFRAPRFFPEMTPSAGFILGAPCVVSDAMPAGALALFDASGFVANQGAITVDARAAQRFRCAPPRRRPRPRWCLCSSPACRRSGCCPPAACVGCATTPRRCWRTCPTTGSPSPSLTRLRRKPDDARR